MRRLAITLGQATILLVDDEPALVEIIGRWLRAVGCGPVLTAGDGEAALAVLATNHIDLLITDVRMPRVDGVTLVRSLARREYPLPSIIFVSGFGDVDSREMYGLGVEAFLAKPFRRDELLNAMRTALADRAELWLEAMPTPPRQTMSVDFRSPQGADGPGNLRLGRGGFSARHQDPLSISKVSFQCQTPDPEQKLCGEGLVRWYSRAEQMVGVEFVFLDPACRAWVIETIAQENPRGFIPARP